MGIRRDCRERCGEGCGEEIDRDVDRQGCRQTGTGILDRNIDMDRGVGIDIYRDIDKKIK